MNRLEKVRIRKKERKEGRKKEKNVYCVHGLNTLAESVKFLPSIRQVRSSIFGGNTECTNESLVFSQFYHSDAGIEHLNAPRPSLTSEIFTLTKRNWTAVNRT